MMRKTLVTFLFLIGTLPVAAMEPVPEYTMKATYLYNFALYTEWPESVGDTINLCIVGGELFGDALSQIQGKQINQRKLSAYRVASYKETRGCHMVFISEHQNQYIQNMLSLLGDAAVLTVTEGGTSAQSGVMVDMQVEDRKIKFNINASAARRVNLNLSSKLLRLARNVY